MYVDHLMVFNVIIALEKGLIPTKIKPNLDTTFGLPEYSTTKNVYHAYSLSGNIFLEGSDGSLEHFQNKKLYDDHVARMIDECDVVMLVATTNLKTAMIMKYSGVLCVEEVPEKTATYPGIWEYVNKLRESVAVSINTEEVQP